ncbi:M16 family metallopeptidase [Xylanibacter brevis]|uniref:M16 family metallopeptidase n=1 Tax=Xylanibacter brevis TaxID=83231 RepID=UPI000484B44B|nr:pitrilysin family protein [Xylanibacter brevis]
MNKKRVFVIGLLAFLCIPLSGLALDLTQPIPESKAVKKGVLKNGMTYYICKTAKNEKASFYIIQPTGSLAEREGEYGLAHFVEHLVFCGTKHYKNNEIVNRIQRMGLQFGPDLNAGTSFEMTFFSFKNIPSGNDRMTTDCLLMLRDMMYDAELNDSDIEKERNVIIEEGLLRQESNEELAGTPFSRPIIGDTSTILHCSPQTIRDFYHRWYQPQMQAVVVVGPFDVERMYEKIRAIFEPVPAGTSVVPARAVIPPYSEPRVFVERLDKTDETMNIELTIRQKMLADSLKNTVESVLPSTAVLSLISPIVETFKRLYGKDISCFTSYRKDIDNVPILHFDIRSDKYGPKELLSKSIKTIRSIADYGFPEEIADEYRAEMTDTLEMTGSQVWESNDSVVVYPSSIFKYCLSNFLYGTPIVDNDVNVKMSQILTNDCGFDGFAKQFRQLFHASAPSFQLSVSKRCEITKDELQEVIDNTYQAAVEPIRLPLKKDSTEKVKESLTLNVDPIPGRVVKEKKLKDSDVWKLTLSNGVTVLMHEVDSLERKEMGKNNRIEYSLLSAYRVGGDSKLDELQHEGLSCITKYDFAYPIGYSCDGANAEWTKHDDVEGKFKEIYHELTNYEINSEDSIQLDKKWRENYNAKHNNASQLFRKTIFAPQMNPNKYVPDSIITADEYKKICEGLKIYKSNYNGMVVAIDYVDKKDSIMPLVLKYIGGLPSKNEPTKQNNKNYYINKDSILVEPSVDPESDYYSMILFQEHGLAFTAENYMLHKALEAAFSTAVINRIRLENGDVYSPYVRANIELLPVTHQTYCIFFSCAHGKSNKIENDMKQLLQEMAYGNAITQQMIDDYIKSVYVSGGIYPQGGAASLELEKIINKGVVVDTRTMKLEKVITLNRVRKYLRSLLKHGHRYEYKNV